MANVWIVGPTGSGKSTLAARLSVETGMRTLEAGSFCREMCDPRANSDVLTKTAIAVLSADHRYFSRKIAAELAAADRIVIGARNPVDFVDSFKPVRDIAICLSAGQSQSPFEYHGIAAITRIIHFWLAAGVLQPSQYQMLDADANKEDWYASFRLEL